MTQCHKSLLGMIYGVGFTMLKNTLRSKNHLQRIVRRKPERQMTHFIRKFIQQGLHATSSISYHDKLGQQSNLNSRYQNWDAHH